MKSKPAYTRADMHTHSEFSHDSVCVIGDMYRSQAKNGTPIFAVTDHFDTASYMDYDVFTPIKKAAETVKRLNESLCGNHIILSGIEISEGFWHPKICEKALKMLDYDVIIGSVHLVKHKNLTEAYSKIDFSKLEPAVIAEYAASYFDDMLTMLETTDFDILAHLTCPLRYIKGKYKIDIDLSRYAEKIDKILRLTINRGIALEVNTSSFDTLSDFMPPTEILKKYRSLGGTLITLGSDAHTAENASKNFDKAIDTLKKIGFSHICFYQNRKPFKIAINQEENL